MISSPDQEQQQHYHHHIDIRGVVLPTWVAIILSIVGFGASIVILIAVLVFQTAARQLSESQATLSKEIRIIQLHIQDIENVLIRSGTAKRVDFAKGE